MKSLPWLLPLGLALWMSDGELHGAEQAATASPSRLQQELTRLIKADAAKASAAVSTSAPPAKPEGTEPVLVLEPLEVTTPRLPDLSPPPREAPVTKFLRTGTIFEFGPRNRRIRLWMKGDKGLMLSMPW